MIRFMQADKILSKSVAFDVKVYQDRLNLIKDGFEVV